MPMTVGVVRLTFLIHGNRSLKGKRKVVKSLVEKCRHRFNVSVAEVDDQDLYQRSTIGVAIVSSDARLVNSLLDQVIDYMDSLQLAELADQEIELIPL
jgi:uncharacterized protein YlxP (DUF503 family)